MADETLTWDMKLNADTSGGTKMDVMLGRLESQLEQANRQLIRLEHGTRTAGAAHKKHGDEAAGLTGALNRLVHQGMEPFLKHAERIASFEFIREGTEELMRLPGELAEKVKELGDEILETAGKAERFDAAFKNALGEKPGNDLLEYIDKIGIHTEFTQDQIKGMTLELAKGGFKGTKISDAFQAASDLGSMTENPVQGAEEAINALRRLQTTGQLQARALMPFGINEKQIYAELSKETGLGVESVKKKLEKGTIDIDTTLNSLYTVITQKTGKALGGAGADMEKLYTTRLKNLKEIPTLIGEQMKNTEGFQEISDFIGDLASKMSPTGGFGHDIVEGMGAVFNTVGDELKSIDLDSVLRTGLDILREMPMAVEALVDTFKDVAEIAKPIFDAMGWVADKVLGGTNQKDVLETRAEKIQDIVGARLKMELFERKSAAAHGIPFPEDFGPKESGIARMARMRKEAEAELDGKAMGKGHEAGLKVSEGGSENAGGRLANAAVKGTRREAGIQSPSKVFADLGGMIGQGFADGIDDSAAMVDAAIARMTGAAATRSGGSGKLGGPGSVSVPIVVNVNAGSHASAEEIADVVEDRLHALAPGALQSALDQLAMQTGSAG